MVLMDLHMPVMDGYQATRILRRRQIGKALPIVAMTANAMVGDREKSLAAGMDDHISKPVDLMELYRTLDRYIKPGSRRTQPQQGQRPLHAQRQAANGDLPDNLPGIDLEEGLKRLKGNGALLSRLICNFQVAYKDVVQEMRKLLESGERAEAVQLAHTIKGVAGNMSATALHHTVKALEEDIQSDLGAPPDSFPLDRFEQQLERVFQAAEILKKSQAQGASNHEAQEPGSQVDGVEAALDMEAVTGRAQRLKSLLDDHDMSAKQALEDLDKLLRGPKHLTRLKALEEAIGRLNFSQAREELDKLAEHLEIEL